MKGWGNREGSGTQRPESFRSPHQMEMVLEEYEVYNPVPLIVGSSVGGLLLLVLITAVLYKVSVSPHA